MPTTISNGQTPFLVSDFITRTTTADSNYLKAGIDFFSAAKIAFPIYAKSYAGDYYFVGHGTGDPTALPAASSTTSSGAIYELTLPTDCIDDGVEVVEFQNATNILAQALTIHQENETLWDTTLTTTAYWRHVGRKIRAYVPTAYGSSTPKYNTGYKRYPAIPTTSSDPIDAPAEDIQALFTSWKNAIIKL